MKKQLSYYVKQLEAAGVDTSKFNLELNGVILNLSELKKEFNNKENSSKQELKELVRFTNSILIESIPNSYIYTSSDLFRKYGCLCLNWRNQKTQNKKHQDEYGVDAYIRNELSYDYQFEFILDNLKPSNNSFYKIGKEFFTNDVLINLCKHAIGKVEKSKDKNKSHVRDLYSIVGYMEQNKKNPKEIYDALKSFYHHLNGIWNHEYKSSDWKDAFKGFISYCAIDYLIKEGKVTNLTLEELQELLHDDEYVYEPYKFLKLLNQLLGGNI